MIKGCTKRIDSLKTWQHPFTSMNVLGLTPCYFGAERRIASFWVAKPQEAMPELGKPKSQIYPQHVAFRCGKDFVINKSVDFLKERNLSPYNFLKDGSLQPMVFPGCLP